MSGRRQSLVTTTPCGSRYLPVWRSAGVLWARDLHHVISAFAQVSWTCVCRSSDADVGHRRQYCNRCRSERNSVGNGNDGPNLSAGLPFPSEAVNHANRRLVGDVIEFHHGYIGGS